MGATASTSSSPSRRIWIEARLTRGSQRAGLDHDRRRRPPAGIAGPGQAATTAGLAENRDEALASSPRDASTSAADPAIPRLTHHPSRCLARAAGRWATGPTVLPDACPGHRRGGVHRRGPDHPGREALDTPGGLRFVQLGHRDGAGPGRLGLRHVAGRPRRELVADPVRGRHARHDHGRPRRDGHRFPAEGGPGLGCIGVQGPHRRLRLEHDGPGPDRGAARRRLQAEGRGHRRRREEPGG